MSKLVGRYGDAQLLKIIIAAQQNGKRLNDVVLCSDKASLSKALSGAEGPTGLFQLALFPSASQTIWEPNAAAKYVGLSGPAPLEAVRWLDFEETSLRPAVYGPPTSPALSAALDALEKALASSAGKLTSAEAGLAEICVFATLLALPSEAIAAYPRVARFVADGRANFAAAIEQVSGGDAALLAAVSEADRRHRALTARRVPQKGARNILITSALPYVNNVPHLGNIIGCVLSADCYARFVRARGYNAIYVCGTDEYGTATETKALEEGLTCQEICDKYHTIHRDIYQWFDIAFDHFGRTPTRQQTDIAQSIFRRLQDSDCLAEQTMEQLYSEALGKFLADRYVVGTCPKCKYDDARGDQCDGCGNLLNPTELINPKCKFSGTTPVMRSTKHIFLDLPQLADQLQTYVTTTSQLGGWSSNCVTTTDAWMRQGLKQRCITRDLKWGTPVPVPGYESKVFYVWFDAPIGYISITANYTTEWEKWWKNPEDVEMVQFMGKDNVPFHTVIFPSTLIGTRDPWTMMKNISVTEYLNYEGGKFSKSRGVGVFGNDAKDTGIPVEVWRYYLLVNRPEAADTDFNWTDLALKNNGELLANVGNLINRALAFVNARFEGVVPQPSSNPAALALLDKTGEEVQGLVDQYMGFMEAIKLKDGLKTAMAVSRAANGFFHEGAPWVSIKTDREHAGTIIAGCVGLIGIVAALMQPFMPSFTRKVMQQLGREAEEVIALDAAFVARCRRPQAFFQGEVRLGTVQPIFRTITEEEVEQLRLRFAGSQADRVAADKAAAAGPGPAAGGAAAKKGGDGKAGASAAKGPATPTVSASATKGGASASAPAPKAGPAAPAVKKEEGPVDVSRLDLRVGLIKSVKRHPDAESLYVEEIDLGEGRLRTVVSGLVKFIPEAEMAGRRVVCVCNLKPAKMRGIESQAMVLAATSADGNTVELVEPPAGAAPGERITFAGFSGEPDEQLNPKKKVFETVSPDFSTDDNRVALYKGVPFTTSAGCCTVKSVVGASIR